MLIEVASIDDAQEILQLQKLAYQIEAAIYDDYAIPPLMQSLEGVALDIQKQTVLKVIISGKIVGSDAIEKHLSQAKRYELFTGHKSESKIRLIKSCATALSTRKPKMIS